MKSVLAALAVIAISTILWIIGINIAWHTGQWVGASTPIPREATVIAFTPSALTLLAGLILLPIALRRHSKATLSAAITSIIMAGILWFLAGLWLAFGSIT